MASVSFIRSNRSHWQFSAASFRRLSLPMLTQLFAARQILRRVTNRWASRAATKDCAAQSVGGTFPAVLILMRPRSLANIGPLITVEVIIMRATLEIVLRVVDDLRRESIRQSEQASRRVTEWLQRSRRCTQTFGVQTRQRSSAVHSPSAAPSSTGSSDGVNFWCCETFRRRTDSLQG